MLRRAAVAVCRVPAYRPVRTCPTTAFTAPGTGAALDRLSPFAPLGWGGLGSAVVLIFWAYAGFELAVLLATEVRDARRTLPTGLVLGMGVATLFCLLTSGAVAVALPWEDAASSSRPLADALGALLAALGWPAGLGPAL